MKSKALKVLCVVFALFVFAIMAMGSGSTEGESKNKGDNGSNAAENSVAKEETKADYKIENAEAIVYTDSINMKHIMVKASVKNTGTTNLFLSACDVDVENASGTLEDTLSLVSCYPQVIKPGETAWYYVNGMYDGTETKDLKAIFHEKVEEAKVDCIRYEVSEVTLKDDEYFGVNVTGRVENKTDEDATLPYVAVLMFDENKSLICVDYNILDDLKAGSKIGFKTSSLDSKISASDVAKYEVYAYPSQMQF